MDSLMYGLCVFYFASMVGCYAVGVWYIRIIGCTVRELVQLFVIGLVPVMNFGLLCVGVSEMINDTGILDRQLFEGK